MSEQRSAICLVIDRLSAAYLGPLGNTWIRTPACDHLASQSLVFDRGMMDSPSLDRVYRSFWTGRPGWRTDDAGAPANRLSLPHWCRDQGLTTLLFTDQAEIAEHPLAMAFDEVICLAAARPSAQAADWQETQTAAFFAGAIELLDARRPPALVWLHTGALGRVWDSPQELRDQYAGEEDPETPALADPPALVLGTDADPDLPLGLRHAYAGEITVLDRCVGMLLDMIGGSPWEKALVSLASARGYPLGEHGIVGSAEEALYGELLRMAWFIRTPGGPKYGVRSQALVQPVDLDATLRDWIAGEKPSVDVQPRSPLGGRSVLRLAGESAPHRELAIARSSAGEVALATPGWFVRAHAPSNEGPRPFAPDGGSREPARRIELFAKPDDYFEANEVSDRCRDIVEEFREVLDLLDKSLEQETLQEFMLSEALGEGLEGQSAC